MSELNYLGIERKTASIMKQYSQASIFSNFSIFVQNKHLSLAVVAADEQMLTGK